MIKDSADTKAHPPLAEVETVRGSAGRKESPPKLIWMFWHQDFSSAPPLVEACVTSWRATNPGWEIRLLDGSSAEPYLRRADIPWNWLTKLPHEKRANILRMRLLTEEGGIWADATTYCLQPLEEWIPQCMGAGFFCFRDPGPDRLVANWFLASVPDSRLACLWRDAHEEFWSRREFVHHSSYNHKTTPGLDPLQSALLRFLQRILNWNTRLTDLWINPFVSAILRTYPYCVMHYIYSHGVRHNPEWRQIDSCMSYRDAKALMPGLHMTVQRKHLKDLIIWGRQRGLPLLKLSSKRPPLDVGMTKPPQ